MICSRLSITLLLTATCLLMDSEFSKAEDGFPSTLTAFSTDRVITCDDIDNVQHMRCDSGVISVQSALYGRADSRTCSEGRPPNELANTQCSQVGTLDVLKKRCNGKSVCEINTNVVRTSDPCFGIFKYLDTTYACIKAERKVACENSLLNIQCAGKAAIKVYTANYGRRDQTTCTYGRPVTQTQNAQCLKDSSKVSESCNGQNSCIIKATNAEFGDPCFGTYKYLEVVYACNHGGSP